MILADANIWIDLFRSGNTELENLLNKRQIVVHPFLVAELALGSLRRRLETLETLDALPQVRVADVRDVRRMIESRRLYARGIGVIDAHLIASCLITPETELWTRDTALGNFAGSLGVRAALP